MVNDGLTVLQQDIFDKITKNDVGGLKFLLSQLTDTVDFVDENGMTPLQHACYKGNVESVQMLLDQVGVNFVKFCVQTWHQFAISFVYVSDRVRTPIPANMA